MIVAFPPHRLEPAQSATYVHIYIYVEHSLAMIPFDCSPKGLVIMPGARPLLHANTYHGRQDPCVLHRTASTLPPKQPLVIMP